MQRWIRAVREWAHRGREPAPVRIGVALGGGFARVLAHAGVLQVLEENRVPVHAIAGISSGAIFAAGYAGGSSIQQMISTGALTSFSSYARWTLSRMGLATNDRMRTYLKKTLPATRFEQMRIPLAVVATDLTTGQPAVFRDAGDVLDPLRASCAYPGLFLPVEIGGRWLVDGGISLQVPVEAAAALGATHVVAVYLRTGPHSDAGPGNIFQVVSRCFAIMQDRLIMEWERIPHVVIEPEVAEFAWDAFDRVPELVEAGRQAALSVLPQIRGWLAAGASRASAKPRS